MNSSWKLHEGEAACTADLLLPGRNSKFIRFYTWFRSAQGILPERSGNSQPLFPGLLPYPEVLDCRGVPLESSAANWAKRLMNEFVAWSNFVVLGCPECRDSCYEPRVVYRSLEEVRLFSDRLLGEVMAFCSPDLLRDSLSLDGKRGDLDALLQTLARSMPSYDGTVPQAPPDSGVALPVLAERMAVPEEAGQVNPADWLDPLKAAVFENLESLRLPEEAWQEIPISCHRVPLDQEAAVMQKLLDTNMVVLVPESDLPRAQNGKLLVGGLFAVKKNSSEDRLIFDRRPENATMRRLRWASLPSGACFTRMLLRSNEYLRGSGDDLRNFYYALGLPETWIRYNAVGRRVDPKIVAAKGLDPRVPHRACFRVLGMGDVNACDVAQATHESILRDAGLLEPETVLVYGKSAPLTDIWEGVYLDDLLVARRCTYHSEVPLDGSFTPPPAQEDDEDMQRVAKAESAYQSAGLKRATHKAFRAEVQFKAWGAEVDGVLGRVSGPLAARRQVWVLIRKVVALGRCTKLALQRLLGLITFHLQFRRELFSLQHHVYKFLASMPDHEIVWLPSFVIDELRSLALHLPFCYTNLRRSIADKVLATDATPSSGGAVLASAPPALAEELWRLSEHRGEALRLDRGSAFLEDAGEPKAPSIFASVAAECMEWEPVASYHFRHTSHINLQEARALKRELVKFASDPAHSGLIRICLNDSRVCVGAFAKGRSSSFRLNGCLRSLLPYLVLGNVSFAVLWVETHSNPADFPSRFMPLPAPCRPPQWLRRFGLMHRLCVLPGLEMFAGSGVLTAAFRRAGCEMLDPVDILYGKDALEAQWGELLRAKGVSWVWLSPPCSSFSPLTAVGKHKVREGQAWPAHQPRKFLRLNGWPEGCELHPRVAIENHLWRHAVRLASLAYENGIPFFLEHPLRSKAWQFREIELLREKAGVSRHILHMCAYSNVNNGELPYKKPTCILTSAPWFGAVVKTCPGCTSHGGPPREPRPRQTGEYPRALCDSIAGAFVKWCDDRASPERRPHTGL